ncbi:cysteine--1-D-myo-inosityl 2-amino-2-deoxy-alpha-D-glucopyranoside ligase [Stackebrandtia nassauensis]|uniref:L-cysteine:1D-myo-inositol 2-amino-2-deoxy-alpha-D-glucopyranoside ligase n=1 Tax=Stackebrandtia nassauensis (strain DSM 44728 / CIP 108903 / NRRL B-16338 / NBRC 102104 / LLR-40K-21) TaxID=446470 RepID=MSHC_STANL|nr:cysteine--1-D-myo-inosityl 2-amino-2-deoxy-alpha-D-glucopyranoside ligase [Stackebrandtia nassauensis]D3Q598.1 RecName: Full=L-cysteine:1D-myo-inositol 2-amino-2-deoxy-alpha-D-glucopyranoside ligase; Short=L-Cys:GlcN-Ins ligase; AltName: Full=Mycothiol ligase; Short=MSH ligase [Stackebrandtia nassauensis DSM 44728]ADD44147.1 cysteine/1-D-myo-inosityl 2-amino-2-deoxy-alpha- D-glucopyranoside ligase [Stackebrandtia nassauensis DSM 44728]
MESWQAPDLKRLGGQAVPLRLYDTARQAVHATEPHPDGARMYVCGITPYDATHLGHAATMVTFDVINRVWRDNGHDVAYVQNVTDVDEPLFERAERDGEDWVVLGMRETALFREDMEALSIIPPKAYVGAVESMPTIAALVERLVDAGAAYTVDDGTGDVYFPVTATEGFGSESHYDRDTMLRFFGERGGDPDRSGKRDPLDALLWRGEREGEPSWESRLGRGRPGWHIECAAIALAHLGDRIDVNGGGNDLIFPHHEFSAAHAEAATKAVPFAKHYVHAGMIGLDGEKMSKSRGNLVFVSRLRADGVDPAVIRLALLDGHYREDRPWTAELHAAAADRLARWREAMGMSSGASGTTTAQRVRERLSDDLDTPGALRAVDEWAAASLTGAHHDAHAPALVRDTVESLLGVTLLRAVFRQRTTSATTLDRSR